MHHHPTLVATSQSSVSCCALEPLITKARHVAFLTETQVTCNVPRKRRRDASSAGQHTVLVICCCPTATVVLMTSLTGGCRFPYFREMFWKSATSSTDVNDDTPSSSSLGSSSNGSTPQQHRVQHKALKALDLRALPRDEGPPTELRARRDKFAFFEQQCSEIAPGLFLGSDAVARNWETLEAAGITHVVNCVGFIYPAYFESKLTYKVLYLQGNSRICSGKPCTHC